MSDIKVIASFSGGRTSAYMCKQLLDRYNRDELAFAFMNTSFEHSETLKFVNECDKYFGLNLVWIEADVQMGIRKSSQAKIVDFENARKDGSIFYDMCEKYGIPNRGYPHCNRELKLRPFENWKKENHPQAATAIGIRVDEIDRMSSLAEKDNLVYPLVKSSTTKRQVLEFWEDMPFNLEIPEHYGNCVTCWKKSERKLKTIALESPEYFDVFRECENRFGDSGQDKNSGKFFKGYQSCDDVIASSKEDFKVYQDPSFKYTSDVANGCGESCDIFQEEFKFN